MYAPGRAESIARERYHGGANCAESVLFAVPEALGDDSLRLPGSAGMGWTAGIAEGGCLCGALAAAVMLAGVEADHHPGPVGGRRRASLDAAEEIRATFKERFGSTCCRVLRHGMDPGSAQCREHCAGITGETAEMVTAILAERTSASAGVARRFAPRDLLTMSARSARILVIATAGFATAALLQAHGMLTPSAVVVAAVVAVATTVIWTAWRMASGR